MFRIRSWEKWQRPILANVKRVRRQRGIEEDRALAMQHVCIAATWDRDFCERFAPLVGQRHAETYFVRVLQFVAKNHGMTGDCPVDRDEFGPLVLTRSRDPVGRKEGQKVYDALLNSGLAVPLQERHTYGAGARPPVPSLPDPSCPVPPGTASASAGAACAVPDDSPGRRAFRETVSRLKGAAS